MTQARSRIQPVLLACVPAALVVLAQQIFLPSPVGVLGIGLVRGLVTALMAASLALVWRSAKIINFAQGSIGMLPVTFGVLLMQYWGFGYWAGLASGLAGAVLTALIVEFLLVRRFRNSSPITLMIATVGMAQLLAFLNLMMPSLWGQTATYRSLPQPFATSFSIGHVVFEASDILVLVVAPAALLGLAWLLFGTTLGTQIRAVADSPVRAASLGVRVPRVRTVVWLIATLLAFLSVWLGAGSDGLNFEVGANLWVMLGALCALVVGKMANMVTVTTMCIALGVGDAAIRHTYDDSQAYVPLVAAILLLALMLQRVGQTRAERQARAWMLSSGVRPLPRSLARLPEVRIARLATWVGAAAVVTLVPLLLQTRGLLKAGEIAIFATVGLSLVVLSGWAGQISLGQMAFVGVGAALGAWGMIEQNFDPVTACILSAASGAVLAVIVGLPALRLRGVYLAIVTLALSMAASALIFSNRVWDWIPTKSFSGARPQLLGRISLDSPIRLYYLALGLLVVWTLLVLALRNSRSGRALIAVRDNDTAVAAYGVSIVRAKLLAFAVSGAISASAGCLFVLHQGAFKAPVYAPEESMAVFMATIVGGIGSPLGAVLGASFQRGVQLLPGYWSLFATSVGALLTLMVLPDGLAGGLMRLRDRSLVWVARRRKIVVPSLSELGDPSVIEAGGEQ